MNQRNFNIIYRSALFLLLATIPALAGETPAYPPFNYVLGSQTFGVDYQFTEKTRLVETAEVLSAMGSNIFKGYLGPRVFGSQYSLPGNPAIHSLRDLVQLEPSCRTVLEMPFDFYFFWTYPFGEGGNINWRDGLDDNERALEYREMRAFTEYLLTTYSGSGKTFYLGHWEGDWSLLGKPYKVARHPSRQSVQGMIDWLNIRQDAIGDAKRETPHHGVQVYHYTEVNHGQKALRGECTVTNDVLPHTRVDYVSYSCYDSLAEFYKTGGIEAATKNLRAALSHIESKLPPKDLPGKRVFIGEYGFPLSSIKTPEAQDRAVRATAAAALEWGCPFILYWAVYCNEDGKGYWLIDRNGEKQPVYYSHQRFLARAKAYVNRFRATHKRNPTPEEYRNTALPWLLETP